MVSLKSVCHVLFKNGVSAGHGTATSQVSWQHRNFYSYTITDEGLTRTCEYSSLPHNAVTSTFERAVRGPAKEGSA
ncbi:hypothetical protein GGF47_000270 [Coemansia sp. RSA 2524]|nr:hypothetical protein GGF47_000270 [Coemansia sp. RSA 2524]